MKKDKTIIMMKLTNSNVLICLKILTASSAMLLIFLFDKGLTTSPQKLETIQKNQVIKIAQEQLEPQFTVSVKDFGAVGDGEADDTSAIQKAIDAVDNAGGGIVSFPNGTYKVTINPDKSHAITIRAKVILQGDSNQTSIIKLADNQGNYTSILTGEEWNSDISDFAMYDLAIDGSGSTNPVQPENESEEIPVTRMRHAVAIYIGSRINIERSRFTNQNGRNVITVNGNTEPFQVSISDVSIKNNIFELIGGGNVDYDQSTIYTHGEQIEISNNNFSSRNGAGTKGARTAIEIHGDEHTVKGNQISGFTNGIYVTGYASSSNNQVITDNNIKEAYTGISVWSYFSDGNTTLPAISNCTIANNKISLNVDGWRELWGNTPSTGITLEPNSDAPIKNLNIFENEISYTNLSDDSRETDTIASGIRLWRNQFPNVISENISVVGNKITNSLASGIYVSMPIDGGEISKNSVLNPGQSNGSFSNGYRASIIIGRSIKDVDLKNNLLNDDQTVNTMKQGIVLYGECEGSCVVSGNTLQLKSNAEFKVFESTIPDNDFKLSE